MISSPWYITLSYGGMQIPGDSGTLAKGPQGLKLFEEILVCYLPLGKIYCAHVSEIVVGKSLVPLAIKPLLPVLICFEEWPTWPRNKSAF